MASRRKINPATGYQALKAVSEAEDFAKAPRSQRALAIRYSLEELAALAPGRSVEVRVPPFGVVQCIEGPSHTRGTPPNVIETGPEIWVRLVTGGLDWQTAKSTGSLITSGTRADLSQLLPLVAIK